MIAPAVHEHQRRLPPAAPIEVVQAETLGDEGLRGRAGGVHGPCHAAKRALSQAYRSFVAEKVSCGFFST